MGDLIKEMLDKKVWAVLGASTNPDKFGYKIYKTLKENGYTVYPVNSRAEEIDGDKCYPDLSSLPEKPQVVNFVIPPAMTEKEVEKCKGLGIENLWIQPGAGSPKAVRLAQEGNMKVIYNKCVMVELGKYSK